MDALVRIHRLGVIQGEFEPRHVVVDSKGHPRIVDFGHAEIHQCRAANRTYKLFELEPPQCEVDCDEIYETATEMDIWTPGRFLPFRPTRPQIHNLVSRVSHLQFHGFHD